LKVIKAIIIIAHVCARVCVCVQGDSWQRK